MNSFQIKFDMYFGQIITQFGFEKKIISESEIALKKHDFAIIVYHDRDGIGVNYIWKDKANQVMQYPIGHLLHLLKRQWFSSVKPDHDEGELEAYASTLEHSAVDILTGDVTWIHQIQINPIPVSLQLREAIGI